MLLPKGFALLILCAALSSHKPHSSNYRHTPSIEDCNENFSDELQSKLNEGFKLHAKKVILEELSCEDRFPIAEDYIQCLEKEIDFVFP